MRHSTKRQKISGACNAPLRKGRKFQAHAMRHYEKAENFRRMQCATSKIGTHENVVDSLIENLQKGMGSSVQSTLCPFRFSIKPYLFASVQM